MATARPSTDFPSHLERDLIERGVQFAGTDEAGRGPLAGPVVAAAVIWNYERSPEGISDSKLLDEDDRRELFHYIISNASAVGVSCMSHIEIDRINILRASLKAMAQAVNRLEKEVELILIDGNMKSPYIPCKQVCCIGGDYDHLAIASASIVAKTVRDNLMRYFDSIYPGYGFSHNFGYPTPEHRKKLREIGPCPIHRTTFNGVWQMLQPDLFSQ